MLTTILYIIATIVLIAFAGVAFFYRPKNR